MNTRWPAVVLVTGLTLLGAGASPLGDVGLAQELTLSEGVYTESQASRGERVYRQICESCHGPKLQGSEMGPSIHGEAFLEGWAGEPLTELMIFIRDRMPGEATSGLGDEDVGNVVAFLLSANGFPPGDKLTAASMEEILLEPNE